MLAWLQKSVPLITTSKAPTLKLPLLALRAATVANELDAFD